jgi:hypothetical protein
MRLLHLGHQEVSSCGTAVPHGKIEDIEKKTVFSFSSMIFLNRKGLRVSRYSVIVFFVSGGSRGFEERERFFDILYCREV